MHLSQDLKKVRENRVASHLGSMFQKERRGGAKALGQDHALECLGNREEAVVAGVE